MGLPFIKFSTHSSKSSNAYSAYKSARQNSAKRTVEGGKKKKKKINFADRAPDRSMHGSKKNTPIRRDDHKQSVSISKGTREKQKESYNETAAGRFTQGVIRNGLALGAVNNAVGTYHDKDNKERKVSSSKAYNAGKIVGDFVSYGTGYGLAGKAIAKATGKTAVKMATEKGAKEAGKKVAKEVAKKGTKEAGEKAVKESAEKAVKKTAENIAKESKVGKVINKTNEKLGNRIAKTKVVKKYAEKEASKTSEVAKVAGMAKHKEGIAKDVGAKAADKITQNLIADATVGTALDTAHAHGEGIDIGANKEYAKYMGTSALANVAFGAGAEGLSAGARAILRKKGVKEAAKEIRRVAGEEKNVAKKNALLEDAEKVRDVQKRVNNLSEARAKAVDNPRHNTEIRRKERSLKRTNPEVMSEDVPIETSMSSARRLKKKGVQEERMRKANEAKAPEITENTGSDYVDRIQTARKYAKDNGIEFSDVVKEHNGNRAEAINDLAKHAEEAKANTVAEEAPKVVEQPRMTEAQHDELDRLIREKSPTEVDDYLEKNKIDISDDAYDEIVDAVNNGGSSRDVIKPVEDATNTRNFEDYDEAMKSRDSILESRNAKNVSSDTPVSVRDAFGSDSHSAKNVEGYNALAPDQQRDFVRATKDADFAKAMNENDGAYFSTMQKGASDKGITDAEQLVSMYREWEKSGRTFETARTFVRTDVPKKNFIEKVSEWWLTTKEKFSDTAESIWQYGKKVGDKELYAFLDRARQIRSYAEQMINGDKQVIVTKDGGYEEVGKSIKGIFEPIINKGDEFYNDFQNFMFHRHNEQRYAKGKPVFGETVTVSDSKKVIADLKKKYGDDFKEFEEYAKEVYKYNDALLRMELESGLINKKTFDTLKEDYPFYVPTYRKDMSNAGTIKDVNEIGTKMFPQATGSNKNILPLHEQMIQRTRQVTDATALNDFGYRLMKDLKNDKKYVEVPKIVDESTVDSQYLTDLADNNIQRVLKEENGKYVFNVKVDGKVWRVPIDKHMFDAISDIGKPTTRFLPLNKANKIFRGLVTTYNPTFGITNGLKDFMDAPSFSKHGAGAFIAAYPRAWKQMMSNSELWQVYKNLGGHSGGFFDIGEQFANHSWFRRNTLDRIERINDAIEQAPRFAEFLLTIEKGGNNGENIIRALNNSKELTVNFGRSGSWGRVINANGGTFFNAAMQDVVRMSRAVQSGNVLPLVTGATLFGIAPSVINELLCGDDENYKALRTGDKDTSFFIPTGDGNFVKIPKGRVVSAIAMPFQRGVREYMGNTDERGMFSGMAGSITDQIAPKNPVTENIFTPAFEAFRKEGGRTWYGADIVPSSLAKLPAPEQYDENTTNTAIALGQALNLSPKRIDYVLKQYTGVGGTLLRSNRLTGADLAQPFGAVGQKFLSDAITNNELQSRVYEMGDKYEKLKNSQKGTQSDNLRYKYISEGTKLMSDYNKQVKEVQADDSLSRAEKLNKVREIRREQNKVAREYLNAEEKMKTASQSAVKQVDKKAFNSTTSYEKALKVQMDVNMRGADALVKEQDEKDKKAGKTTLSTKLKEAGISSAKYYELKAKNISLETYNSAKSYGVSLEQYSEAKQNQKKYTGGYLSQAVDLIKNKTVKDEDEAKDIYNINKSTYKVAKAYADAGYSSEELYKLTGDIDQVTQDIKDNYGHDTWKNGTIVISKEGLKKYLDSRKELSQQEKHNLWYVYGWGRADWIRANPY